MFSQRVMMGDDSEMPHFVVRVKEQLLVLLLQRVAIETDNEALLQKYEIPEETWRELNKVIDFDQISSLKRRLGVVRHYVVALARDQAINRYLVRFLTSVWVELVDEAHAPPPLIGQEEGITEGVRIRDDSVPFYIMELLHQVLGAQTNVEMGGHVLEFLYQRSQSPFSVVRQQAEAILAMLSRHHLSDLLSWFQQRLKQSRKANEPVPFVLCVKRFHLDLRHVRNVNSALLYLTSFHFSLPEMSSQKQRIDACLIIRSFFENVIRGAEGMIHANPDARRIFWSKYCQIYQSFARWVRKEGRLRTIALGTLQRMLALAPPSLTQQVGDQFLSAAFQGVRDREQRAGCLRVIRDFISHLPIPNRPPSWNEGDGAGNGEMAWVDRQIGLIGDQLANRKLSGEEVVELVNHIGARQGLLPALAVVKRLVPADLSSEDQGLLPLLCLMKLTDTTAATSKLVRVLRHNNLATSLCPFVVSCMEWKDPKAILCLCACWPFLSCHQEPVVEKLKNWVYGEEDVSNLAIGNFCSLLVSTANSPTATFGVLEEAVSLLGKYDTPLSESLKTLRLCATLLGFMIHCMEKAGKKKGKIKKQPKLRQVGLEEEISALWKRDDHQDQPQQCGVLFANTLQTYLKEWRSVRMRMEGACLVWIAHTIAWCRRGAFQLLELLSHPLLVAMELKSKKGGGEEKDGVDFVGRNLKASKSYVMTGRLFQFGGKQGQQDLTLGQVLSDFPQELSDYLSHQTKRSEAISHAWNTLHTTFTAQGFRGLAAQGPWGVSLWLNRLIFLSHSLQIKHITDSHIDSSRAFLKELLTTITNPPPRQKASFQKTVWEAFLKLDISVAPYIIEEISSSWSSAHDVCLDIVVSLLWRIPNIEPNHPVARAAMAHAKGWVESFDNPSEASLRFRFMKALVLARLLPIAHSLNPPLIPRSGFRGLFYFICSLCSGVSPTASLVQSTYIPSLLEDTPKNLLCGVLCALKGWMEAAREVDSALWLQVFSLLRSVAQLDDPQILTEVAQLLFLRLQQEPKLLHNYLQLCLNSSWPQSSHPVLQVYKDILTCRYYALMLASHEIPVSLQLARLHTRLTLSLKSPQQQRGAQKDSGVGDRLRPPDELQNFDELSRRRASLSTMSSPSASSVDRQRRSTSTLVYQGGSNVDPTKDEITQTGPNVFWWLSADWGNSPLVRRCYLKSVLLYVEEQISSKKGKDPFPWKRHFLFDSNSSLSKNEMGQVDQLPVSDLLFVSLMSSFEVDGTSRQTAHQLFSLLLQNITPPRPFSRLSPHTLHFLSDSHPIPLSLYFCRASEDVEEFAFEFLMSFRHFVPSLSQEILVAGWSILGDLCSPLFIKKQLSGPTLLEVMNCLYEITVDTVDVAVALPLSILKVWRSFFDHTSWKDWLGPLFSRIKSSNQHTGGTRSWRKEDTAIGHILSLMLNESTLSSKSSTASDHQMKMVLKEIGNLVQQPLLLNLNTVSPLLLDPSFSKILELLYSHHFGSSSSSPPSPSSSSSSSSSSPSSPSSSSSGDHQSPTQQEIRSPTSQRLLIPRSPRTSRSTSSVRGSLTASGSPPSTTYMRSGIQAISSSTLSTLRNAAQVASALLSSSLPTAEITGVWVSLVLQVLTSLLGPTSTNRTVQIYAEQVIGSFLAWCQRKKLFWSSPDRTQTSRMVHYLLKGSLHLAPQLVSLVDDSGALSREIVPHNILLSSRMFLKPISHPPVKSPILSPRSPRYGGESRSKWLKGGSNLKEMASPRAHKSDSSLGILFRIQHGSSLINKAKLSNRLKDSRRKNLRGRHDRQLVPDWVALCWGPPVLSLSSAHVLAQLLDLVDVRSLSPSSFSSSSSPSSFPSLSSSPLSTSTPAHLALSLPLDLHSSHSSTSLTSLISLISSLSPPAAISHTTFLSAVLNYSLFNAFQCTDPTARSTAFDILIQFVPESLQHYLLFSLIALHLGCDDKDEGASEEKEQKGEEQKEKDDEQSGQILFTLIRAAPQISLFSSVLLFMYFNCCLMSGSRPHFAVALYLGTRFFSSLRSHRILYDHLMAGSWQDSPVCTVLSASPEQSKQKDEKKAGPPLLTKIPPLGGGLSLPHRSFLQDHLALCFHLLPYLTDRSLVSRATSALTEITLVSLGLPTLSLNTQSSVNLPVPALSVPSLQQSSKTSLECSASAACVLRPLSLVVLLSNFVSRSNEETFERFRQFSESLSMNDPLQVHLKQALFSSGSFVHLMPSRSSKTLKSPVRMSSTSTLSSPRASGDDLLAPDTQDSSEFLSKFAKCLVDDVASHPSLVSFGANNSRTLHSVLDLCLFFLHHLGVSKKVGHRKTLDLFGSLLVSQSQGYGKAPTWCRGLQELDVSFSPIDKKMYRCCVPSPGQNTGKRAGEVIMGLMEQKMKFLSEKGTEFPKLCSSVGALVPKREDRDKKRKKK